jgi:thiol-disulfide isomerase/thioredoxin
MRKYAPFAALFLRALAGCLSLAIAAGAFAADLRDMKEPKQVTTVFPAGAKLRVLNLWATWCVPCVAEMPDLKQIDDAFGTEVALAGVSLDDMIPDADRKRVAAFLDKQKIAFPNVYYKGNADDLAKHLKFSGEIPVTIVYDAKGKELWRHQGRLDKTKTIAELRKLLGRK